MKTTSFLIAVGLLGLTATGLRAQVAINNTAASPDASAILDLKTGNTGVNKGFLPQAVALTSVAAAAPVISPATGLIVYSSTAPAGGNGIGYYYWTGTAWASMGGGVSGSGAATEVAFWNGANTLSSDTSLFWDNTNVRLGIGTKKPQEGLDVCTYNTPEVAKFGNANPVCIVANSPMVGFNAFWNNTETYYSSTYAGMIEFDQDIPGGFQFTTAPSGVALTAATMTPAMSILNNRDIGIATPTPNGTLQVLDNGNFQTAEFDNTLTSGTALAGSATGTGNSWGVYANSSSGTGYGVYAANLAATGSGSGVGVYGTTAQSSGYGIEGTNTNAAASYLGSGIGMYGAGAGASQTPFVYGQGVYGEGTNIGVMGYADGASGTLWPVYAANDNGLRYSILAEYYNSTDYKVYGSGTVSTVVKDNNNQPRIMNCPEAPEILFEDYGTATLSGGKVHVDLDPVYAKNVTINENHPLRVMITLNDQCNGVYVTNRTASGFDVVELSNGTSNALFTYEVIANRADSYDDNGTMISKNADNRFVVGFKPLTITPTTEANPNPAAGKPAVPAFVPAPRGTTPGSGTVSTITQK